MTQPRNDDAIDWGDWLRRWDRQQTRYVPFREERFNAMFDAMEALLPPDFVALDLGVALAHSASACWSDFPGRAPLR